MSQTVDKYRELAFEGTALHKALYPKLGSKIKVEARQVFPRTHWEIMADYSEKGQVTFTAPSVGNEVSSEVSNIIRDEIEWAKR